MVALNDSWATPLFGACDPDLHCLTAAIVDADGCVLFAGVVKAKGAQDLLAVSAIVDAFRTELLPALKLQCCAAVAVESQKTAYTGRTNAASTQDLIHLAHVSGAVHALWDAPVKVFRYPSDWKGSVPKHIHQKRTMEKVGWRYEMQGGKSPYPVPSVEDIVAMGTIVRGPVTAATWRDLTDSVGLALDLREMWKRGRLELAGREDV